VTRLVISRSSSRKSGRLLCLCFQRWRQETLSDFAGTPADPGDKELPHMESADSGRVTPHCGLPCTSQPPPNARNVPTAARAESARVLSAASPPGLPTSWPKPAWWEIRSSSSWSARRQTNQSPDARQEEFSDSGAAAPRLRAAARKPPPFGTATQSLAVLAVRLLYACPRCEGLSPRRDPAVKPRWSEHSARAPTLRNGRRR
jgi:hypothetical protein